MRFWAQLQRDEQAKNILSSLSKLLEVVALEQAKGEWKHPYRLLQFVLSFGHAVLFLFSIELCNNWLCTSRDVEAGCLSFI